MANPLCLPNTSWEKYNPWMHNFYCSDCEGSYMFRQREVDIIRRKIKKNVKKDNSPAWNNASPLWNFQQEISTYLGKVFTIYTHNDQLLYSYTTDFEGLLIKHDFVKCVCICMYVCMYTHTHTHTHTHALRQLLWEMRGSCQNEVVCRRFVQLNRQVELTRDVRALYSPLVTAL